MITDKDITKLKSVFSTKEDLARQLKPIKDDLKQLKKDSKVLKKDVRYIRKTTELTLKYIDEENRSTKNV